MFFLESLSALLHLLLLQTVPSHLFLRLLAREEMSVSEMLLFFFTALWCSFFFSFFCFRGCWDTLFIRGCFCIYVLLPDTQESTGLNDEQAVSARPPIKKLIVCPSEKEGNDPLGFNCTSFLTLLYTHTHTHTHAHTHMYTHTHTHTHTHNIHTVQLKSNTFWLLSACVLKVFCLMLLLPLMFPMSSLLPSLQGFICGYLAPSTCKLQCVAEWLWRSLLHTCIYTGTNVKLEAVCVNIILRTNLVMSWPAYMRRRVIKIPSKISQAAIIYWWIRTQRTKHFSSPFSLSCFPSSFCL